MRHATLVGLLLTGGLCAATGALAQAAPPAAPDSQATTPAPPAESLVRVYGTLNARITVSSAAVESFTQPNAVAITAAGNPILSNAPDRARYTFQVGQTRFGLWVNEKGAVRGQVELDFADFTKATPTVASQPRVRIARVEWAVAPAHLVALGQDWDLHAPANPHGINIAGALFQGGNAGFMRQQLKYLFTAGNVELAAAVGFPFNNNTPKESVGEIATAPTLAVRGAYKVGKDRVGASAITTALPFSPGTPQERFGRALSVSLFAELTPMPTTNLRLEANAGQNGASLGLLTLAQGRADADLPEAGGFVSLRHALAPEHALLVLLGTQHVLGDAGPRPSYAYPPGSTDPSTATLAGTGPGLRGNTSLRLGYEFKPLPTASLLVEGFLYQSRHTLQEADAARGVSPLRRALGVETGLLLTF